MSDIVTVRVSERDKTRGGGVSSAVAITNRLVVSSKLIRFKLRFNFNQLELLKTKQEGFYAFVSENVSENSMCLCRRPFHRANHPNLSVGKKVDMFLTVCGCVQEIHCSLLFVAVIVAVGGPGAMSKIVVHISHLDTITK